MNIQIVYILIFLTVSSCVDETKDQNTKHNIANKEAIADSIAESTPVKVSEFVDCQCFDGIGSSKDDKPIFTFDFSNGKSVSLCGYYDYNSEIKNLVTEFNVFDCATGNKLVKYGAFDNCFVKKETDKIVIQLLELLPSGENWEWEFNKIGVQTITIDSDKLKTSDLVPDYEPKEISTELKEEFLSSLTNNSTDEDWEYIIGKLELLSLNGNDKAWEILKNYDEFSGIQPDGAFAEVWNKAKTNVEWIKSK